MLAEFQQIRPGTSRPLDPDSRDTEHWGHRVMVRTGSHRQGVWLHEEGEKAIKVYANCGAESKAKRSNFLRFKRVSEIKVRLATVATLYKEHLERK